MTSTSRLFSIAFAAALFAPIALLTLTQAAGIVG